MPGRSAERHSGHITQLDFASIAERATGESETVTPEKPARLATFGNAEVYRPAPRSRRKTKKRSSETAGLTQATLDDLFAQPTLEVDILPSLPIPIIRAARHAKHNGQYTQLGFDSLPELFAIEGATALAPEPVENRNEQHNGAVHRPDEQPGVRAKEPEPIRLENTHARVPGVRRRIILDEPEPEARPSRDFRITPEHGVGSGSLHDKAKANIAAIRLLKTIEAEKRDATDNEKALLVRYAGWGALAQVFEYEYRRKPEWNGIATDLHSLLTSEEYESARATTPNAHFTSPLVIHAIWQGLEKMGIRSGGEVLEPAMGIGHFFGLMPETLQGGHRTGVELDTLTARIAKKLYPDSTIFHQGFEETALPDEYFDAVVGNVPFGDYPVHDLSMKHSLTRSIHDYFFAKSLEKTRPGGLLALITSRFTMDKQDGTIRTALAEKADLIAAIRLPNTAFKGNAGTEVTTDILFLQKRAPGQEPAGERWTETNILSLEDRGVPLNEYFISHPEMMLGQMKLEGTMYGSREPTLAGELTQEILQHAIDTLPSGIYISRNQSREPSLAKPIADPEQYVGIKDGGYAVIDEKIVKRCGNRFEPTILSFLDAMRVRGLMRIRDSVREVFRTQLDNEPEEHITRARQQLNIVYDQFVRRHGFISSRENTHAYSGDPDQPLLLSLENYNAETMTATKSVIFTRRTLEAYKPISHVDTAAEALAISLNETGSINVSEPTRRMGNRR